MIRILFLAANPIDTPPLRLDEESRSIQQALRQAQFRDTFEVEQQWAVRVSDLQELLLRYQPSIVHFSGHGSNKAEIILQNDQGLSQPVSERALGQLFSILRDNIRCVVLNACFSYQQGAAIAEHIDCVIGMSDAIADQTSLRFASAFYQALGYGRDVKTAFDLGCLQINLENLGEQEKPQLLAQRVDPRQIFFVQQPVAVSTPPATLPRPLDNSQKVEKEPPSRPDLPTKQSGLLNRYGLILIALAAVVVVVVITQFVLDFPSKIDPGGSSAETTASAAETATHSAVAEGTTPATEQAAPQIAALPTPTVEATLPPTEMILVDTDLQPELSKAAALMGQAAWQDAIDTYNLLIPRLQQADMLVEAYFQRGFAYDQIGANDKAIADYSQVLETAATMQSIPPALQTMVETAGVERGILYALEGDCANAIPDLKIYLAKVADQTVNNDNYAATAQNWLATCGG